MDIEYAVKFGQEFIAKHPHLKDDVNDLFQLMNNEIDEGGSVENEVNLFIGSCNDLLE